MCPVLDHDYNINFIYTSSLAALRSLYCGTINHQSFKCHLQNTVGLLRSLNYIVGVRTREFPLVKEMI